jgi:hypothetical protein
MKGMTEAERQEYNKIGHVAFMAKIRHINETQNPYCIKAMKMRKEVK